MKYKKQFVVALCCIILLSGIFLAISYLGDKYTVFNNNKSADSAQSTGITTPEAQNNKGTNANGTEDKSKVTEQKKEEENKETLNENKEAVKEGYYVVKSNDTLYSIARTYMPNYDSSKIVSKIRERNNLKEEDPIITGQKLIITYEEGLAKNDKSEETKDVSKTVEDNKSKETAENTTNEAAKAVKKDTASEERANHIKYTVKSGDTLYSIANEFFKDMNTVEAVDLIKQDNELKTDVIKVDDTLYIPQTK